MEKNERPNIKLSGTYTQISIWHPVLSNENKHGGSAIYVHIFVAAIEKSAIALLCHENAIIVATGDFNIRLTEDNQTFPTKKVNLHASKTKFSTDDPRIRECKNRLDILYVISNTDKSYRAAYNETKKDYNRLLAENKSAKLQKRIRESDNKSKCVWSIVNEESILTILSGGNIEKKLNGVCYSLRILSKYIDLQSLKVVYHANLKSIIQYGIIFYGQSTERDRYLRCLSNHRLLLIDMCSSLTKISVASVYPALKSISLYSFGPRKVKLLCPIDLL
ncbi:hypothetical protein NQ317_000193 [Molorchus minor]|uniref:Uncharacterized protein n=1 Tax=Molorchus minor TaxID=1323400 RepID=A0ABQ9JEZ1_9CUCU|nr:hypothetical protein NQ317_000193 [Molorchus minor]